MCDSEMYDSNSVKAMGKCLHSIHLVRGLYPEYIKNSQKLNSKKPNNPILKKWSNIRMYTLPEEKCLS